jgi:hypothetical protein
VRYVNSAAHRGSVIATHWLEKEYRFYVVFASSGLNGMSNYAKVKAFFVAFFD